MWRDYVGQAVQRSINWRHRQSIFLKGKEVNQKPFYIPHLLDLAGRADSLSHVPESVLTMRAFSCPTGKHVCA